MAQTHREAVREIIVGVSVAVISAVLIFFLIPHDGDEQRTSPDTTPSAESELQARRSPPAQPNRRTSLAPLPPEESGPPANSSPPVQRDQVNFSGSYNGAVTPPPNGGRLVLRLRQEPQGKLKGTFNLSRHPLAGAGSIEGHVSGDEVSFTSTDLFTNTMINWSGTVLGPTLAGDFTTVFIPATVKAANPQMADKQNGKWVVLKSAPPKTSSVK